MRTLFTPITIYTQPGCAPCHQVQQKLDDAGISYDVINITKNGEAYTYVTEVLKAKSVPVIVDDHHEPIIGYGPLQQEDLEQLIDFYSASETGL